MAVSMSSKPGRTAQGRYDRGAENREPYLRRGREIAKVTLPFILPPLGHNASTSLVQPYQSVGARGVNNLAAKMLLALLPPNQSFFRLLPSSAVKIEMDQMTDDQKREVLQALAEVENRALIETETANVRSVTFELTRQLLITGNCLFCFPEKGPARFFPLSQYVVRRDADGNLLEIIVKETIAVSQLDPAFRAKLDLDEEEKSDKKFLDLYTVVCLTNSRKNWRVYQEVKGVELPGSGLYALDKLPWLPLTWHRIDGEEYGRGFCEDFFGDLMTLEDLSRSIVLAAGVQAKVVFRVKPGSTMSPQELSKAETGDFIVGEEGDISAVQVEKSADMQSAFNLSQIVTRRLELAFLMNTAIQRDGERVTAEEIRYMASELENGLGGVYSRMAVELQKPLAKLLLIRMAENKSAPALPPGTTDLAVVTGMEALGRNHEMMRLQEFLQFAGLLGPTALSRINAGAVLVQAANGFGVNKDIIYTEAQVQQQQQQAQIAAMLHQATPNAVTQLGQLTQGAMAQSQGEPPK